MNPFKKYFNTLKKYKGISIPGITLGIIYTIISEYLQYSYPYNAQVEWSIFLIVAIYSSILYVSYNTVKNNVTDVIKTREESNELIYYSNVLYVFVVPTIVIILGGIANIIAFHYLTQMASESYVLSTFIKLYVLYAFILLLRVAYRAYKNDCKNYSIVIDKDLPAGEYLVSEDEDGTCRITKK